MPTTTASKVAALAAAIEQPAPGFTRRVATATQNRLVALILDGADRGALERELADVTIMDGYHRRPAVEAHVIEDGQVLVRHARQRLAGMEREIAERHEARDRLAALLTP